MTKERLEELQTESEQLEKDLTSIDEKRRKLAAKETELLEDHQNSLRPLRNLQYLDLSVREETVRQELMHEVNQIGGVIEEWATDRREALKREERRLEDRQQELSLERQKLALAEEDKQKKGKKEKKQKESTDG